MKKVISIVASLVLSSTALAIDYNGGGGAIPDLGSITSDIVVPDSFSITDVDVRINNLTHTWVGDIQINLSRVTGGVGSADVVNRIGVPPGAGDSSDYGGTYTFDSQGAGDIWTVALGLPATGIIPSGTYWTSGAGSGANNLSLNQFNGQNAAGTWRLTISDHAGADIGSFGGWTLSIVPEPASLALLALGGLALIRRR